MEPRDSNEVTVVDLDVSDKVQEIGSKVSFDRQSSTLLMTKRCTTLLSAVDPEIKPSVRKREAREVEAVESGREEERTRRMAKRIFGKSG
mmetsp:Transcript_21607/g.38588  ORF Transcript_21607/g.38588 Transcript_21607/m.38588 type:complete len:90 (-) Transcript_21607:173-442(-)